MLKRRLIALGAALLLVGAVIFTTLHFNNSGSNNGIYVPGQVHEDSDDSSSDDGDAGTTDDVDVSVK